jgi:hypothetical protein
MRQQWIYKEKISIICSKIFLIFKTNYFFFPFLSVLLGFCFMYPVSGRKKMRRSPFFHKPNPRATDHVRSFKVGKAWQLELQTKHSQLNNVSLNSEHFPWSDEFENRINSCSSGIRHVKWPCIHKLNYMINHKVTCPRVGGFPN